MQSILGDARSQVDQEFHLDLPQLQAVAEQFQRSMAAGLQGAPGSLKMLPSYLDRPTGSEGGEYLAIDFGGTNIRVLLVELLGNGQVAVKKMRSFLLKDNNGSDYTAANMPGYLLFDAIARQVAAVAAVDKPYSLGFTFSFPCRQQDIKTVTLLGWTKEIKTAGVEGEAVGQLLNQALLRQGLPLIQLKAIINDTVGTLLAGAYQQPQTVIGAICGTGHNACYREMRHPLTGKPMVVNMESGNFDGVAMNKYDVVLDKRGDRPGRQRLEKMVSGRYIGELLGVIVDDWQTQGLLSRSWQAWQAGQGFSGRELASMLSDHSSELSAIGRILAQKSIQAGQEEKAALKAAAGAVVRRSARLIAASFAGVLIHMQGLKQNKHIIAVDGSLYEKMPGYAQMINTTLAELAGEKAKNLSTVLIKDGSGIGAAIAAAIAER